MKYFPIILLLFLPEISFSYSNISTDSLTFEQEISFTNHLITSRYWRDADYHINQILPEASESEREELYFLSGWNAYQAGWQRKSVSQLARITPNHPRFTQSQFYLQYQKAWLAFNGENESYLSEAYSDLGNLNTHRTIENELREILLAGFSLLNRDFDQFEFHKNKWTEQFSQFENEQEKLRIHADVLQQRKSKSAGLAALFSAVIPGSGKMYAGRTGEGLAALIQVGIPAVITWESYRKNNTLDTRTIISGSVTALVYSANIYGSYIAVRTANQDFNDFQNTSILLDIHIPVRTLFQ